MNLMSFLVAGFASPKGSKEQNLRRIQKTGFSRIGEKPVNLFTERALTYVPSGSKPS
jgi:hypothetical protein